jgi:hypothetical protein
VLTTAEQNELYMQEHQFKARGIGEGVPEGGRGGGGGGGAASRSLTKPKSPVFSTASRKRPASVLSREQLEEEYMKSHQFKPRAIGEGVPENGSNCATRSSANHTHTFKPTIGKAPKLSTSMRRRPASSLTREEQEVEYMKSHQFKPRAVGEGVAESSGCSNKRARTSAQESFRPTVPNPPKLRTSSRRRAAAVLSTAEYEELHMQEHQFKALEYKK